MLTPICYAAPPDVLADERRRPIYKYGVLKPRKPIHLEEHTELEVVIPAATPSDADDPTGWKAAE